MSTDRARASLAPLILTVFIDLLGFGLTIPLLPLYARTLGASAFEVTLLAAAYSAAQFAFVPVWGALSDRVGRRPVLLASIVATAVSMALLGFAGSYPQLLAVRVAQGIATANIATAQAYIADVTTPATRTRAMGLIGAAFGVGFVLGPFFGGVLAHENPALPGLAAAGLAVINFALAWRGLPESLDLARAPRTSRWEIVRDQLALRALRRALAAPGLAAVVGASFLHGVSFTQLEATFALHLCARLGFGPREVGYAFAFLGVVVAVMQGAVLGRVARRFGEVSLVRAGLGLLIASMALVALLPAAAHADPACRTALTFPELAARSGALAVALAVTAVGNALITPSVSALVTQAATEGGVGAALGAQQSAGALARVVGPSVAGVLFVRYGSPAPYWCACVGMVMALAITAGLRGRDALPGAAIGDRSRARS